MIKFHSKIFEEIIVEGAVTLEAKRKFRILLNYDMEILSDGKPLVSVSTSLNFLKVLYQVKINETGYQITIENNNVVLFDEERYEVKTDRFYLFKKKYAEVWINNRKAGDILFEKKFINVILHFVPEADFDWDENSKLKIAILILINIADLDGSS